MPDIYIIEVKSRKMLPQWPRRALAQAQAAQRDGQLSMVVLHQTGTRHADDLVVVRLGDLEDWCSRLQRPDGEAA